MVHAFFLQTVPDLGRAHQIAVGVVVDPLGMGGEIGDAGHQGKGGAQLLLVVGHQLGAEGVGGDHGVRPPLPQQLGKLVLEEAFQRGPSLERGVLRGFVVDVIETASVGHQQGETLVDGLGGVGQGVGKKVLHGHIGGGKGVQKL